MAEHPNAQALREGNRRMEETGDPTTMGDMLTDDVVWHEIGRGEPIRGKDALMERYKGMPEGVEFKVETHDVVANDEHAVMLVNVTASMGGQSLNYRTAEIYHMRDGKIAERWAFSDDTEAINRFFGGV